MRRTLIVLAVLLVVLVAADQVVRVRIQDEVERAAGTRFAAASVDADVRGLLVLPQLLAGELEEVELHLTDAVLGDPTIRVLQLDAELQGVTAGFPPPATLDRVELRDGIVTAEIHEREVERLLRQTRPDWAVRVTEAGVVASGTVEGVPVQVTADVVVDGQALRFRARAVDAGALGPDATQAVARAFDTSIELAGLPEGVVLRRATPGAGRLVVHAQVTGGTLSLA